MNQFTRETCSACRRGKFVASLLMSWATWLDCWLAGWLMLLLLLLLPREPVTFHFHGSGSSRHRFEFARSTIISFAQVDEEEEPTRGVK